MLFLSGCAKSTQDQIADKNVDESGNISKAPLLEGKKLVHQQDNKKAIPHLENYIQAMNQYMKDNPPPKDEKAKESFKKDYMEGVAYLRHANIQTGDPEGAVKAMANVEILDKWLKPNVPSLQGTYEQVIMKAQAKLDTAEAMKAQGKEGWEPIVKSVLKSLEEIYRSHIPMVLAAVERARALCLLGRYEEGLKELGKYMTLIKNMDKGYKDAGVLHMAVSAKAYLWKGKLQVGMAEKAGTDQERAKYYFDAGKCFLKVMKDYEGEKCPYYRQAVSGYNDVREKLKGLNPRKPFPQYKDKVRAIPDDFFNKQKYGKALPLYLKILLVAHKKNSPDAPDLLYRVTFCYLKTGHASKAMEFALVLARDYPKNKDYTPISLLLVAEHFWKIYKFPKTAKAKLEALRNALKVYDVYLRTCPKHQYAAQISARVAKVYYDQAQQMARHSNGMIDSEKKLQADIEARMAFKKCIPLYKNIVDNYPKTEVGKISAYLLPWCYSNSKQYPEAAKYFLLYTELESNWAKPDQRLMGRVAKAKYYAAESFVQEAKRLEATKNKEAEEKANIAQKYFQKSVTNLNELLDKWGQKGGRLSEVKGDKDQRQIAEAREKAYHLLGWAYDGAGEKEKAIKAFKNYIKLYPNADNKKLPEAMFQLFILYRKLGKNEETELMRKKIIEKYPEKAKQLNGEE